MTIKDLFMGYLGNGCTCFDRSRRSSGDYLKIAHIATSGSFKITWYELPEHLPAEVVLAIERYRDKLWEAGAAVRIGAIATMQPTAIPGVLRRNFSRYDDARRFAEIVGGYEGYYYYGNEGIVYPVFKEV